MVNLIQKLMGKTEEQIAQEKAAKAVKEKEAAEAKAAKEAEAAEAKAAKEAEAAEAKAAKEAEAAEKQAAKDRLKQWDNAYNIPPKKPFQHPKKTK